MASLQDDNKYDSQCSFFPLYALSTFKFTVIVASTDGRKFLVFVNVKGRSDVGVARTGR